MPSDYLTRYDEMADRAANAVIAKYSTSFGLATRLLAGPLRRDIRNLYAMVRIADEIVDGTAAQAELNDIPAALAAYEHQVRQAPKQRFHTDPVIHAYAQTARRCHFRDAHVEAFFASMRRDLHQSEYSNDSLEDYIYGSAEVIGLLCLAAFYADIEVSEEKYAELEHGARSLGAAFQKVNFLRDFREDTARLGRNYYEILDNQAKDEIIASIRGDLEAAHAVIPDLPDSARTGVLAATLLFEELTDRLAEVDAAELHRRRIRVPGRRKALLLARAVKGARR